MSEYSSLYIAKHYVDDFRNSIGYGAILFTEDDFLETDVPYYEEIGESVEVDEETPDTEGDEAVPIKGYRYQISASAMIERLEIMGYTLERTKMAFDEAIMTLREEQESFDFVSSDETARLFDGFDFELWSTLMKRILDEKLRRIFSKDQLLEDENPQLHYMLGGSYLSKEMFGFPCDDSCYAYRAILELVGREEPVVLDFSSLIGWVEADAYSCSPPKTIILTEGSSDKWALEETLKLLYPHLFAYFSFLNFDAVSMPGSAGHLTTVVKAFLGTGISSPLIALFDNDTAGCDALRQMRPLKFPASMKAMALPDLELAKKYPTIGPQGEVEMDVNGLACSIELYFGRQALSAPSGSLIPIQWTGYNSGMKQYQGELLNKREVQTNFRRIIEETASGAIAVADNDWSGMKSIFEAVFSAFH